MRSTITALTALLTPLLAAPTTTPRATAPGHAYVHNACTFPIYLWSVSSNVSSQFTIPPKQTYTEALHYDPQTGISIKVTTVANGLTSGSPQMNFAYAIDPPSAMVYYDLSDVFGDPFAGFPVQVTAQGCPGIAWGNGTSPSPPVGTKACADSTDLVLSLC